MGVVYAAHERLERNAVIKRVRYTSLSADRRARRIDPSIQTSVQYTYWAIGD